MNLVDLEKVRAEVLAEIDEDRAAGRLYLSPRLSEGGEVQYPELLRQAAERHDVAWLISQLRRPGILRSHEQRAKPKGGYTQAAVPVTAPETLAGGELNRYYIRGLCRYALAHGITEVVGYRAREVANPRPDSAGKIGQRYSAEKLLADLRANVGIDTALGLPSGPNSGLSVKLP